MPAQQAGARSRRIAETNSPDDHVIDRTAVVGFWIAAGLIADLSEIKIFDNLKAIERLRLSLGAPGEKRGLCAQICAANCESVQSILSSERTRNYKPSEGRFDQSLIIRFAGILCN